MSDVRYPACSFEGLLVDRARCALADGKTFRSSADRSVPTNPRADPWEILTALAGTNEPAFVEVRSHSIDAMFWEDGALVLAEIERPGTSIRVMSPDLEAVRRLGPLAARLDPFAAREPEKVGVWAAFSTLTKRGVLKHTRFVDCPRLDEIRGNYPARTLEAVDRLARDEAPWSLGKLVIWSGPPGTGKTHALRSLMLAWQPFFEMVVVTDPERFAEEPSYYFDVVDYGDEAHRSRPKLIVMEDAADLILLESRARHFDKLGKLLNLTDGLFGQGRKDLFLVTFNEEFSEIDPAFLRPGRCRARIEFPALSREESRDWLGRHGIDHAPRGEMTLAEVYRKLHEKIRCTNGERPVT